MRKIIFIAACVPATFMFVILDSLAILGEAIIGISDWYGEKLDEFEKWAWHD